MDASDTAKDIVARHVKDLVARQQEIFQELDDFYKGVEEHEGPYPSGQVIREIERELFDSLANVTYDIHRMSRVEA